MVVRFLRNKVWIHLPTLEEIQRKDLVLAAWLWPLAILVIAGLRVWGRARGGESAVTIESWLLGAFAVLLGLSLLTPRLQAHVFLWILRLLGIIGYVVVHALLILGFFLLVTPLGLILRLMGKDLLDWRRRGKKPAWHEHQAKPARKAYYRQF